MNWRVMSDFKEDDFYVFLSDKMKLGEPEYVKDFFFQDYFNP